MLKNSFIIIFFCFSVVFLSAQPNPAYVTNSAQATGEIGETVYVKIERYGSSNGNPRYLFWYNFDQSNDPTRPAAAGLEWYENGVYVGSVGYWQPGWRYHDMMGYVTKPGVKCTVRGTIYIHKKPPETGLVWTYTKFIPLEFEPKKDPVVNVSLGQQMIGVQKRIIILGDHQPINAVESANGCNILLSGNELIITPTTQSFSFRLVAPETDVYKALMVEFSGTAVPFKKDWKFTVQNSSGRILQYRVVQGTLILKSGSIPARTTGEISGTAPSPTPVVQLQYLEDWYFDDELNAWLRKINPDWKTVDTQDLEGIDATTQDSQGNISADGIPIQNDANIKSTQWSSVDATNKFSSLDKGTFVEGISKIEHAINVQADGLTQAGNSLSSAANELKLSAGSFSDALGSFGEMAPDVASIKSVLTESNNTELPSVPTQYEQVYERETNVDLQKVHHIETLMPQALVMPEVQSVSIINLKIPIAIIGGAGEQSVDAFMDLSYHENGIMIFKLLVRLGLAVAFYFAVITQIRAMFAG